MNNKLLRIIICIQLIVIGISAVDGGDANSDSGFDLKGVATGAANSDVTNIIAAKEIIPSGNKNSPDIKLTLKMPPTPAKLDIVLAMDTSGSMVQSYMDDNPGMTQIDWASNAIGSMIEQYKEANVSIVSWDDEDESDDTMTRFYNLSIPSEKALVEQILRNLSSECRETDHTIYSIGIKRAVEVLDRYPPSDPYNTARIIIFVTGLSEFLAEPKNASNELALKYQLQNAKRSRYYINNTSFDGYQVFPVQIGIDPKRFKWEWTNVSMIMNETKIRNEPRRNAPYSKDDINELNKVISNILFEQSSKPVAHDVVAVDTLYPFLEYLGSESLYNNISIDANKTRSPDCSTTLTWNIGNMNSSDTWSALIHTRLNLSLPIEVSDNRTEIIYGIANSTPISEVRYTWLTGFKGILPFPEGEIKFDTARS